MFWSDVHAFDLGGLVSDPAHTRRADRIITFKGQQEATVRWQELGDRCKIPLHSFSNRKSKTVSRFEPVVTPGEVLEPQAFDCVYVARQFSISDFRHVAL